MGELFILSLIWLKHQFDNKSQCFKVRDKIEALWISSLHDWLNMIFSFFSLYPVNKKVLNVDGIEVMLVVTEIIGFIKR